MKIMIRLVAVVAVLMCSCGMFAHDEESDGCWYVGVEGGMALSTKMDFAPDYSKAPGNVDFKYPTYQNPNFWRANMGSAPMAGAKVGYFIDPQFALELGYTFRGNFEFNRAASLPTGTWYTEATNTGVHAIDSHAIMLNARFFPCLDWGRVKPFVNVGGGLAINQVGHVVEKTLSDSNPSPMYDESSKKNTPSFAWQAGFGFDYIFCKHVFLTVAYRFVDIGKIKSGNRIEVSTYDESQVGASITPLLQKNAFVNEVYVGLNYQF